MKGMFRISSCHSPVPIQDRCVNLRAVASLSPTLPPPLRRPKETGVLKGVSEINPKSRPPSLLCSRTNGMVGESSHALRWFPGGQWLEKKEKQPDYGSVWAGCSPPLSWPGRVPGSQGAGQLFKDLGHRCSLLSAKIQRRTPVPPAAASPRSQMHGLIHSLTHPLSYSARIYHVLAAVWQAPGTWR